MVYCPYSRVHFGMGRIPSLIGSSPRSVSDRKSSGIPPRRSNVHAYTAVCVVVQSIATDASNLWSAARGISTSWTRSMESYCYCTFDSTISTYNRTYVTVQCGKRCHWSQSLFSHSSSLCVNGSLGFVYIGMKVKSKVTSLPNGFIMNPI